MITYSALDNIENIEISSNNTFFKNIDSFNDYKVSAFVSQGKTKLVFLYEDKVTSEDAVKKYLEEAYQLYVVALMNPFLEKGEKIFSKVFNKRMVVLSKKYFR